MQNRKQTILTFSTTNRTNRIQNWKQQQQRKPTNKKNTNIQCNTTQFQSIAIPLEQSQRIPFNWTADWSLGLNRLIRKLSSNFSRAENQTVWCWKTGNKYLEISRWDPKWYRTVQRPNTKWRWGSKQTEGFFSVSYLSYKFYFVLPSSSSSSSSSYSGLHCVVIFKRLYYYAWPRWMLAGQGRHWLWCI